jgi:hypothetical protein
VLEYVSKRNKRKDYEKSFQKYERHLKVPYYLAFYPDNQELTLFQRRLGKYAATRPNEQGRHAIPQLDMEIGLVDGWVRYWFRGELLPLPADLQRELEEVRRRLTEVTQRAVTLQSQIEEERRSRLAAEQELAQLRAQLEQLQARPKGKS